MKGILGMTGKEIKVPGKYYLQMNDKETLVIFLLICLIAWCGCIGSKEITLSNITLLSEFNGPGNYTVLQSDVLGDAQNVIFYVETTNFKTQKDDGQYEFWVSMDITIGGPEGEIYVEKLNDREIHIKNATSKPTMVYYKYPWNTANLVQSGEYWVKIAATDKLSGNIVEMERKFQVDLNK